MNINFLDKYNDVNQNSKLDIMKNEKKLQLRNVFTIIDSIDELTLNDILPLVKSIVWDFHKLSFFDIKKIEDKILNKNISFEKKQIFLLSILVYYVNNNFFDDIIEMLKVLFPEINEEDENRLLTLFIKKVNIDIYKGHDIYYLLYARLYVIKDYLFVMGLNDKISKKNNDLLYDNVQLYLSNFINYWIKEVNSVIKNNDKIGDLKLTFVLTVLSHLNYYLAFIEDEKYLKQAINMLATSLISINEKIKNLQNIPDFHKQVLYAIISFIITASENNKCLDTNTIDQIKLIRHKLGINFDDMSFEMRAFIEDYCGMGKNNVNYVNLVGSTKEEKFVLATTLNNISYYHNLIGKRALILEKYLEKLYSLEKDNIFLNKYSDNIYLKISDIEKQIFSFYDIDGVVKEFFIRILKLPLNVNNMHIYIKFFNNNFKNIDVEFLDFSENTQYISLSKYKKVSLVSKKRKIDFYIPKNYDNLTNVYDNNKAIIDGFMDKISEKLLRADGFINDIIERVDLLKKSHRETFNHMTRVGILLKFFIESDNFKKEQCILRKLSNYLHIKMDKLYAILGYLHDIGKSDNNLNLQYYNDVNVRDYVLNILELFLSKLENDVNKRYKEIKLSIYGKLVNKYILNTRMLDVENNKIIKKIKKEISNVKKYNLYIMTDVDDIKENDTELSENEPITDLIKKYSKDEYISKQIFNFYSKYRLNEFLLLSYSTTLNISLHNVIYNVYTRLKELGVDYIDIFEYGFKKKFNKYFQYLLNKNEILSNNDKFDINIYILALLIILDKISYYHSKELKEPHILGGERFISKYPDFSVLSWTLIHHMDYPNLQELKDNKILNGLEKWRKLIGLSNFYFSENELNSKNKEKIILDSSKRDVFMVLLTTVDIIDAILSKRNYQGAISYKLAETFIKENIINQLYYYYSDNMPSSISERFDKVVGWLEKDFKNNQYWPKVKNVLLKNKNDILKLYKNKGKSG